GFAYLDPQFYALYRKGFTALLADGKSVVLPSWFTGGNPLPVALNPAQRQIVVTLFNVEESFVNRLAKLDDVIDKAATGKQPVPVKDLEDAARHFVETANDLDSFGRENTFFAIFDRLVKEGGSGKGRRQSAMLIEITPAAGEKVTKYLTA